MSLELLSNDAILKKLGKDFEKIRIEKCLSDEDVCRKGGATKSALNRLKNGENINLVNLIKILKGIGEIDRIDKLFYVNTEYSPLKEFKGTSKVKKRIRKKKSTNETIVWGDEINQ